jgi:cysteate synthase
VDRSHENGLGSKQRHYALICSGCGAQQDDDGLILECGDSHEPSLLRTQYYDPRFIPCRDANGLFRYRNWLPVASELHDSGRTVVFHSRALGKFLGMPNLWIAFNGYWPERGATLETCTFKELEAYTVLARSAETATTLTVASAGNTAAAFALACSRNRIRCLLIVPERGLGRFRFAEPLDPCVRLVVLEGAGYTDAIRFSDEVAMNPGFHPEGGSRNVGRRDALATVILSAFEEMHRLPDYYFQAVGSGTGGIAAHEAAWRLREARDDAGALPRLMLCQNKPFIPIYDAWRSGGRTWAGKPEEQLRDATKQVHADELTNWSPPYSIHGGLYDVLTESSGEVLVADSHAAITARELFEELEGIDIEPAPGVALACLRNALAEGLVPRDSVVLLNVTGGGRKRAAGEPGFVQALPDLRLYEQPFISQRSVDRAIGLCMA